MLSEHEHEARKMAYVKTFGQVWVDKQIPFKPALWPASEISTKIAGLIERGFKDPQKLITSLPAILGLSFENIDTKIAGLIERGFKDPQKLITSLPAILGYSFENIDTKIAGLIERGFKDPQKLITSSPAILGLSFENIDTKIAKARRLGVDIQLFISYNFIFIGMSSKNYVPILKYCRAKKLNATPKNISNIYKKGGYKIYCK